MGAHEINSQGDEKPVSPAKSVVLSVPVRPTEKPKTPGALSFPRMRESSDFAGRTSPSFWIPTLVGMTGARHIHGVQTLMAESTALERGAGKPPLHNGGFTLVEVLAALAILGGAMFILLNTHYSALRLHEEMASSVLRRELMERVVSDAEFKVLAGTLTESGEFEGRYAGYSWAFNGTPMGGSEDRPLPFYQVQATLRMPDGDEESLNFYVFNISSNEVLAEGATNENAK